MIASIRLLSSANAIYRTGPSQAETHIVEKGKHLALTIIKLNPAQ